MKTLSGRRGIYLATLGLLALAVLQLKCGVGVDTRGALSAGQTKYYIYATTQGGDNRVYGYQFDPVTGALTANSPASFPAGSVPGMLAVDPSGSHLYVTESGSNAVEVFSINPASGALTSIQSVSTGGSTAPSQAYIDPKGVVLAVLDGVAGQVINFPILADGTLGVISTLTAGGTLLTAGAYSRDGLSFYAVSNALYQMPVQTSTGTLGAANFNAIGGNNYTGLAAHPSLNLLYVSDTTASTIVKGSLTSASGGLSSSSPTGVITSGPKMITLRTDKSFLYITRLNNILSFRSVDNAGGLGSEVTYTVSTLASAPQIKQVISDPSSNFILAADYGNPHVRVFSSDPATGALKELATSPAVAGGVVSNMVLVKTTVPSGL